MKIDLFKLNNLNKLDIDQNIEVDSELFKGTDIREIKDLHISGTLRIEYDEVMAYLEVNGTFILPCAITLEDVSYPFETVIDESIGNFNDIYEQNKNTLDLLPVIWSNIVAEVPIRVVKEGAKSELKGDGWELTSSD